MRNTNTTDNSASPDRQYGQRLKPRRGGLFIDTEPPPFFFFLFFGGAYIEQTYRVQPDSGGVSGHDLALPAPPKNKKKKGGGAVSVYKQATPTGFGDLES